MGTLAGNMLKPNSIIMTLAVSLLSTKVGCTNALNLKMILSFGHASN